MRTLQENGISGRVTLPKDGLERDGVLKDGEFPEEQNLVVDRLGRRVYLIRLVEPGGSVPDPEDTEVVQRLAAQRIIQQDAFGTSRPADD